MQLKSIESKIELALALVEKLRQGNLLLLYYYMFSRTSVNPDDIDRCAKHRQTIFVYDLHFHGINLGLKDIVGK